LLFSNNNFFFFFLDFKSLRANWMLRALLSAGRSFVNSCVSKSVSCTSVKP